MTAFHTYAICACLLLLFFLLFKEIRRKNKSRLGWRILANIIGIGSFAFLLIPLTYKTQIDNTSNEVTLVTAGANADEVPRHSGNSYAIGTSAFSKKGYAPIDLLYFLQRNPEIQKLNVYGYGLSKDELEQLKGYQLFFHPAKSPDGVSAVSWPHQVKVGEAFRLQGHYQNHNKKAIQLVLKGLGKNLDSLAIEANADRTFSFSNHPKLIGKAIYELIALQGKDTLSTEPVPFEVIDSPPLKVLMLASFPDFEYKFLKNWLYENKYPMAWRSRMSKDKFATDFLNLDRFNLNQLNSNTLKDFDVLLIDEEELAAISAEERNAISRAVDRGLGLIVRVSTLKALTPLSGQFSRFENQSTKAKPLNLRIVANNFKLTTLPPGQILFLTAGENDQPLITEQSGKILVNSTLTGRGKIVNSTVGATYQWLLSGKKETYTTYWSEILTKTSKKKTELQTIEIQPTFPSLAQKAQIKVNLATSGQVPMLKVGNLSLSPRQNMELPFQWDGFYWPSKTGWTTLKLNQQLASIYFYKKKDWQTFKNQELLNINQQYAKKTQKNSGNVNAKKVTVDQQVSLWWFFFGFLFSFAFLWYEAKALKLKAEGEKPKG